MPLDIISTRLESLDVLFINFFPLSSNLLQRISAKKKEQKLLKAVICKTETMQERKKKRQRKRKIMCNIDML